MAHPGLNKWAQNVGDLRLLSLKAPHPRSIYGPRTKSDGFIVCEIYNLTLILQAGKLKG